MKYKGFSFLYYEEKPPIIVIFQFKGLNSTSGIQISRLVALFWCPNKS